MAKVYRLDDPSTQEVFDECCLTFGVFDGFHAGHQFLVDRAVEQARLRGVSAVVLTFDCDPDELFRPDSLRKLSSNSQRIERLCETQLDAVVLIGFNKQVAGLDPLAFLERTFGSFPPSTIHVGKDFRFGCKGSGRIDDLRFWGDRTGTEIYAYDLVCEDGQPITASRIRGLLQQGKVADAARLLGRPFSFEGLVEQGRQQGRDMGFRTANVMVPAWQSVVAEGVYVGYAWVDGKRYKAALSMGVSPTFVEAKATCEVHILDFEGDLYGKTIVVELVEWLREMRKFDDINELIATVMGNIQWCRDNL